MLRIAQSVVFQKPVFAYDSRHVREFPVTAGLVNSSTIAKGAGYESSSRLVRELQATSGLVNSSTIAKGAGYESSTRHVRELPATAGLVNSSTRLRKVMVTNLAQGM